MIGPSTDLTAAAASLTPTNSVDHDAQFTFVNPLTGKKINANLTANWLTYNDGYNYNNMFMTSNAADVNLAVGFILQHGWKDDEYHKQLLYDYLHNSGRAEVAWVELNEIISDAKLFTTRQGVSIDELNNYYDAGGVYSEDPEILKKHQEKLSEKTEKSAQEEAYDEYYRDLYSLEEGTLGRQMLDNYTTAEQNAALSNMQLAEAQYQQAAMQQAETVKAITDSVKSERMARLRAGMSESQIANQDMQTMLTNMNTLNQSTNTLNQNRLAAQQQYNLAQDTAYQQYIQSATGMGGTSAAFSASASGSAHLAALNYMKMTGETNYNKALNVVQGNTGGNK